jgi:hypothetical protein
LDFGLCFGRLDSTGFDELSRIELIEVSTVSLSNCGFWIGSDRVEWRVLAVERDGLEKGGSGGWVRDSQRLSS